MIKRALYTFLSTLFIVTSLFASIKDGDPVGRNKKLDKEFRYATEYNDSLTGEAALLSLKGKMDQFVEDFPRDWRVYYWKSYYLWKDSQFLEGDTKMKKLDEADHWAKRSDLLYQNNSETHILRAYILHERIMANPSKKAKYKLDLEFYMDKAYQTNPSNARYMLLQGIINLKDTVGDNADAAKLLAKKYLQGAIYFNEIEFTNNRFEADPKWGRERAELLLSTMGVATNSNAFDNKIIMELDRDIEKRRQEMQDRRENMEKAHQKKQEAKENGAIEDLD